MAEHILFIRPRWWKPTTSEQGPASGHSPTSCRGRRLGSNCNVGDHAFLESGANVGNNVTIKNNVCIWTGVTLEDDVFVGPNATFTNDRQPRSPRMAQARETVRTARRWLLQTTVERGVSIGANATILPGVRLARTA